MKQPPIDVLVYNHLFPRPKPSDPQNFQGLLQRLLVTEVRQETACFYGSLDSREAQYPGLDYSHPPHRLRLGRYRWHRKLFQAFNELGLTKHEIACLTKWEGTRWAKERFEKEQGITIRDTTAEGIADYVEPELRLPRVVVQQPQEVEVEEMEDVQEEVEEDEEVSDDGEDEIEDSDVEVESVGLELNERLRARAALREAGHPEVEMDEEWESWLKEAAETGGIPFLAEQIIASQTGGGGSLPTSMPPRILNAARLGQWHQIPEFLHNVVRQNIESGNDAAENTQNAPFSSARPEGRGAETGPLRNSRRAEPNNGYRSTYPSSTSPLPNPRYPLPATLRPSSLSFYQNAPRG